VGVKVLRGDKWQIEEDLVLKKRKVYILVTNFIQLVSPQQRDTTSRPIFTS